MCVKPGFIYVLLSFITIVLQWNLSWETTCLDRTHIFGRRTYISIQLNLSPETTCLDTPHFCGQWGGLSRQVLLYPGKSCSNTIGHAFFLLHCFSGSKKKPDEEQSHKGPLTSDDLQTFPTTKKGRAQPQRHIILEKELQKAMNGVKASDDMDNHLIITYSEW